MTRSALKLGFLGACLSAGAAQAEATWTFGALAVGDTGVYVGAEDDAQLVPYVSFSAGRFEASLTDGLTYDVLSGESAGGVDATLSLRLAPRWAPDFSDDAIFAGLERDTAIEAGLSARVELANFFLSAEALSDISDTHNGSEARLSVGFEQSIDRAFFEVEVGAIHRDGALNQYLFGVTAAEANATRAAYTPGDTTTSFASLTAGYMLTDALALVGQVTHEDLGDLIASPLVAQGENTSFALGLIFEF